MSPALSMAERVSAGVPKLIVRVSITSSSGPGVSAQEENISAAATSNNTPLIVLFLLFIPYVRFF